MSAKKSAFRSPRPAAKSALGNDGFVPHRRELLESAAWRTRPINVMRLIEYLEAEHLRHCGKENGFLTAPYGQLERHGIGRRFIKDAIDDAVARGLVRITRQGSHWHRTASRYQLTYLAWKLLGATGPEYVKPTDEWRDYRERRKQRRSRQRDGKGRFVTASKLALVINND